MGAHICLPPPQLAYGQDGQLKGFAVLEYETAEMAEEAQQRADGLALGGSHLRVSFCAPGPPGRSMLAALIAAQATVSACPGSVPLRVGEPGARPSSLEKSGCQLDSGQEGRVSPHPCGQVGL